MLRTERRYRKIDVLLTAGILVVTLFIGYQANEILSYTSQSTHEIMRQQRAASVKPILRVVTRRTAIGNKEGQALVIKVSNIGTGTAKDIAIIAKLGSTRISDVITNLFPSGTFPILQMPNVNGVRVNGQTTPVLAAFHQKPVLPVTGGGQDFMHTGEELEFQIGSYPYGKMPAWVSITLFMSYFDVDDNEYLVIVKQVPGFESLQRGISQQNRVFDSLDILARGLDQYEYRTLVGPELREPGGFFQKAVLQGRKTLEDSASRP